MAINQGNLSGVNARGERVKNIGKPTYPTDALQFKLPNYTTTERDALPKVEDGMIIYNTTTNAIQVRVSSSWTDLGSGGSGAILSDGTVAMAADLDLGSNQIKNLAAPSAGTDAANRNYVNSGTATLTNKTLTSPVINNPSGLDSADLSDFTDASGSSGYYKIGNILVQWGVTPSLTTSNLLSSPIYYSSDSNITFPQAYKAATVPRVTCGLSGVAGGCWANIQSPSNTGFTARLIGWSSSETSSITWHAIGVYK